MATPNQEAIETFMSITGSSESVAIQKLTEHGGDLNVAVNAHFTEGDRNIRQATSIAAPPEDFMDIDDPTLASHRPPLPLFPSARDININPFSLLDPNFTRSIFDSGPGFRGSEPPFVSHPREVRQIPIEVKDGPSTESHSGHAPRIEDVTDTTTENVLETHGRVIIDEDDDDDDDEFPTSLPSREGVSTRLTASAPGIGDSHSPDHGIEEEMIRAAIEASKQDSQMSQRDDALPNLRQLEDPDLAQAVSLSLKTAEQEKALRHLGSEVGPSEPRGSKFEVEELDTLAASNGRLDVGRNSSSIPDEVEDVEEEPLVRNRIRFMPSSSIDSAKDKDIEEVNSLTSSSTPQHQPIINPPPPPPPNNGNDFHEWGGISSLEHDEAVMLEAALFGGIPEGTGGGYNVPYAPHQFMQNGLMGEGLGSYPRPAPRPPSPSLTAQRLIREQQDDEYLASLQADREKELLELSAKEAAMEEERRKEEEQQEIERQLAAKEASLPHEPSSDDENAVTLLVRMPDGSRRGRRFLRTDKLQYLFNFIDVARVVKPGSYRLVRPYPRRAFSDGESSLTLDELGLSSKQEALFLESI